MTSTDWQFASPVDVEARRPLMKGERPERTEPTPQSWRSLPWPPRRPLDYSQAEARLERERGWAVHYLDFDVRMEVEQVCGPLSLAVSEMLAGGMRLVDRRFYRIFDVNPIVQVDPLDDVESIARSVQLLRVELVKVLADLRPVALLPEGARDRLSAVVRDPAHVRAPAVSEADLVSGAWVDLLVAHVAPVAEDLAHVVAAQPAGIVSDLDVAISAAVQMPGRADGFANRTRMLAGRLPELRSRYASAVNAGQHVADDAAQREQELQAQALRELGLS